MNLTYVPGKKNLSTTTQTTMAGGTRIDADTLEF